MPIQECSEGGEPGYKWGEEGKCYTYTAGSETSRKNARHKAHIQGISFEFTKGIIEKLEKYIKE
jgi:hypothetical protein